MVVTVPNRSSRRTSALRRRSPCLSDRHDIYRQLPICRRTFYIISGQTSLLKKIYSSEYRRLSCRRHTSLWRSRIPPPIPASSHSFQTAGNSRLPGACLKTTSIRAYFNNLPWEYQAEYDTLLTNFGISCNLPTFYFMPATVCTRAVSL